MYFGSRAQWALGYLITLRYQISGFISETRLERRTSDRSALELNGHEMELFHSDRHRALREEAKSRAECKYTREHNSRRREHANCVSLCVCPRETTGEIWVD